MSPDRKILTIEEFADDRQIQKTSSRAPVPAGSDPNMTEYLRTQLDRTIAALGEIDETLELHGRILDTYQPKSNEKIGLFWERSERRLNNALQPRMVRWLMRQFSGQYRWFYTFLPLKALSRKAKSKGGWGLGVEQTRESLNRIQDLIEHRRLILHQWVGLSRSLSHAENYISDLERERASLREAIPKGPFYEQSLKYNRPLE
ncbi:hypothetical protein B1757_02905 [Acidithiobacillus marinus]|uniref:Uncharacterized protein n=1 Tax=Acidithiobacillus marinus TaxID=187490 RepID=A0A2I1DPG0_9PROT|nr:hypothetical protein [Acidithiobacillus marinus]PKY11757.1 hypothetical protein B1757_02905 [Acidithiobacillus marinus]